MKNALKAAAAMIALAAFAAPPPAGASCISATECYCVLSPYGEDAVLVEAEVESLDSSATLLVIGEPYHDPGGTLHDGWLIPEVRASGYTTGEDMTVGSRGLFSIDLAANMIQAYLIEEDGRFSCRGDSDFPGATAAQLAGAVLSDDCPQAVYRLGVQEGQCKDSFSSCAACGSAGGSALLFLFLAALIFVVRGSLQRESAGADPLTRVGSFR